VAGSQSAERLSRPVQSSTVGSDGRVHSSSDATVGNLIVDQYSDFGHRIFASNAKPAVVADALKPLMCNPHGAGAIAAHQVADALKGMSKDERARLKSRDAAGLTELSIMLVAAFDGVSANAIRSDEALGPGIYHDAIYGFRVALDVCHFFGE